MHEHKAANLKWWTLEIGTSIMRVSPIRDFLSLNNGKKPTSILSSLIFSTFDTIHSGMQKSNAFDLRSKIFLRSNGSKYHLCDHLLRTFIHRLGRLVRHFCDIIGICFWVCADFVCKIRFCYHFHFHFDVGRADIVRVGWWCDIIGINILFSGLSFSHGTFHKMTQRGENTLPEKTFAVVVDDRTVCSR